MTCDERIERALAKHSESTHKKMEELHDLAKYIADRLDDWDIDDDLVSTAIILMKDIANYNYYLDTLKEE